MIFQQIFKMYSVLGQISTKKEDSCIWDICISNKNEVSPGQKYIQKSKCIQKVRAERTPSSGRCEG